jgi:hypothetical protein
MSPFKPLFLVALLGLALPTWAEDVQPTNADGTGELSLPWTAFEKLLRLDQDNVILTWDEFQRLVKQTGVQEMPPFQLQDGKVSLSRTEFKNLLNRMKLPAGEVSKNVLNQSPLHGPCHPQRRRPHRHTFPANFKRRPRIHPRADPPVPRERGL